MPQAVLASEILAELRSGCPADGAPKVLDSLCLTVDREPLTDEGEVRSSTAVWVCRLRKIAAVKVGLWGLSVLADDALLLLTELVTNALRYGTQRQISFCLLICPGLLVLEVDDGSPGWPQLGDGNPDAVHGRGLILVNALSDSWGVSADGTKTWCILRVPTSGQVPR